MHFFYNSFKVLTSFLGFIWEFYKFYYNALVKFRLLLIVKLFHWVVYSKKEKGLNMTLQHNMSGGKIYCGDVHIPWLLHRVKQFLCLLYIRISLYLYKISCKISTSDEPN